MHRRALIASAAAFCAAPNALAQRVTVLPPLPPPLTQIGATALTLPDGAPTTIGELAPLGRPAVISFWATWCAPCLEEARHLARVRNQHAREALTILGVNVDRYRDEARMNTFLNRAHVNFAQARADAAVYEVFGNPPPLRLPRLYVFYADGAPVTAIARYSGRTLTQIDQAIARAFAGP